MVAPYGYAFTLVMGVFSVLLLGWDGFQSYSSGWVFGFLAVIWSLLMMMRLMTLATPAREDKTPSSTLAQKILNSFYERQEERHHYVLMKSMGGSFVLFFAGLLCFLGWQIFCALAPSQKPFMDGFMQSISAFQDGTSSNFRAVYDWGQMFMLALSLSMMAFVLRTHAPSRAPTRSMMIVVASYAVAGLITFLGLSVEHAASFSQSVSNPGMTGSGAGTGLWLAGALYGDGAPTMFELLLIETGIGGVAMLAFMMFVPLGAITLGAPSKRVDSLVLSCAMIIGICLIISVFLPMSPALGAYMLLCLMGLFLAWGAAEVGVYAPQRA